MPETRCSIKCVKNSLHTMYTIVQHHCETGGKKVCKLNELKRTLNGTGGEVDGAMKELHVNRQNNPPLAQLGPLRLGKAKANKQSEGIEKLKTGGSLHVNEDGTQASPES